MTKALSDIITEFVWNAAHNNKKYGIRELKVIQSMHPTVEMYVGPSFYKEQLKMYVLYRSGIRCIQFLQRA